MNAQSTGSMIRVALLLIALGAAGCRQTLGEPEWTESRLVFGMNIDGRPGVTESEWQKFLAQEVTPRFPDGLTVVRSEGQWRGGPKQPIEREDSRILVLIHPASAQSDEAIAAIARAYKAQFRQDSVLRIEMPARVTFE